MEVTNIMRNFLEKVCCIAMLGLSLNASALQVTVLDDQGAPIQGAAVWLEGNAFLPSSELKKQMYSMGQKDRAFTPHTLIVPQGAQVEFPNFDSILHHVYSFSSPKPFELKLYRDTPKTEIEFDNQGVVELGCNIHDWMLGYILVINSGSYALTNEQGIANFDLTQAQLGEAKLHVWHERYEQLEKSEVSIIKINDIGFKTTYKIKQGLMEALDFSGDETDDY